MKIIHAHLNYIWNKSTKNLKETLKALGEVDFTKYGLLLYISNGQEMAMLKNDVNLSKSLLQYYKYSCTSSKGVEHVCKVLKRNTESPRRS